MVRIQTPKTTPLRKAKLSTRNHHTHKPALKYSPIPRLHRSPLKLHAQQSSYRATALPQRSKLFTIREESPDAAGRRWGPAPEISTSTRQFDELADCSDDDDASSGVESYFEGWDDETTLVAKLQNDAPETSERARLGALADGLGAPMQAQGVALKRYLAHTIAPAAKRVEEVHVILEQRVEVAFGIGVLSFDDTCKKMEKLALQDEEELKDRYVETQRSVARLFTQLKAAYEKRDRLWLELRERLDQSASQALESLAELPPALNDAAIKIEKRAKEVLKNGPVDGKAREKMLRELLAGM